LGSSLSTGEKVGFKTMETKDLPTPTKFKVVPSVSKVMATVFWDMTGAFLVEFQEHGRTVNVSSYFSLLE